MKKIYFLALVFILFISSTKAQVVINEVYGGGGNSGATYTNDFVELYNNSGSAVSLTGWSIQYASASGATWQVTNLSGNIPAKGYYLIQQAMGSGGTTNLPTPDATGIIPMSATAGKVALVNTTTTLTGSCPAGAQIIDLVGYGTANCFETSVAPAPSNTNSIERKTQGGDVNDNGADFATGTPTPRNSSYSSNAISVAAGADAAESSSPTAGNFTFTFSPATSGSTTLDYSLTGTAAFNTDYSVTLSGGATPSPLTVSSGTITVPASTSSVTVTITPINDAVTEGNETVIFTISNPGNGYALGNSSATINITDDDAGVTLIHAIQGAGAAAIAGNYTVEAIVTGVYPTLSPAGFYIQEEDSDNDADPNTSEGIFVVSNTPVNVGDKVRVTGTAQENGDPLSYNQAIIHTATVTIISTGNPLPSYTQISLPVSSLSDWEKYEGMLVRFPATLTVTDIETLGNFGEVMLSAGGLRYQPTQIIDPNDNPASGTSSSGTSNVAAINAQITADNLRSILLDDGRGTIPTLPYVNSDNTLRIGSTISNLSGILGYAFSQYRVQPVTSAPPTFTYAPRPGVPSVGAANLKVASFNVLNYFNGDGMGGGFPTSRGANSAAEFTRQRDKIISAISQLNADIVGLIEIENDGTAGNSAIQDLVNGLNAVMGAGTYSIVDDDLNDDGKQDGNTDEIRCAIIYKSASVSLYGNAILSSNAIFDRPPLAQTFISNGKRFNYIINHFKSKGSCPGSGIDADQGDGQSCWNNRRKLQATELINFINNTVHPAAGTNQTISMGDYNAYYEEDPLDILRANNFIVLNSATDYSYLFDGQVGSLDHAVVTNTINSSITGSAKWHINSAEPEYLDYNDGIDDGANDEANPWAGLYTATPYRSSDHDAVLVGLDFNMLNAPLPVTLIGFKAEKGAGNVKLSWQTVTEINSSHFIIERSADGITYTAIGKVKAAGNSGAAVNYEWLDATPNRGYNLYRLKLVDADNSAKYSRTVSISFVNTNNIRLTPNPAKAYVNVWLNENSTSTFTFRIVDVAGKVVRQQSNTAGNGLPVTIQLAGLNKGMYLLKIIADNKTYTEKIVVH